MTWTCGKFDIDLASTRVMGIVNVTPDSFSDGGLYLRPGDAVSHARALVRDGADVIDVGAESTRPGHRPLPAAVEWARLEPVLRQLLRELPDVPVSVDTYHAETARRAIDAGAAAINCVYTPDADMWSLVEEDAIGRKAVLYGNAALIYPITNGVVGKVGNQLVLSHPLTVYI